MFRIALVVALLSAGGAYIQTQRLDAAKEHLDTAQRKVAGLERGLGALTRHIATQNEEVARWRETVERLEQHEGVDDPLNDYERAVFDSVRE